MPKWISPDRRIDSAKLDGEVAVRAAIDAQKIGRVRCPAHGGTREYRQPPNGGMPCENWAYRYRWMKSCSFRRLPVRVEQVTGVVGSAASGPVLSVTDNQIVIDSSLPLEAAALVKPGMEVAIDEPALGFKAKGIVESVAASPGTHGVDGYHFYFAVRVGETQTPLQGFSLRLTMPVQSTAGAVIAVPMSARFAVGRWHFASAGPEKRFAGVCYGRAGVGGRWLCGSETDARERSSRANSSSWEADKPRATNRADKQP